ncbi:MAG: hypothetical protein ACC662_05520 [Planctomycetota bacterium]
MIDMILHAMRKTRISITLSTDLLRRIDREAHRGAGGNRSAVIEAWLRRGARSRAEDALREETIAYYEGLSKEERAEDAAIARAAGRLARRLRHDD